VIARANDLPPEGYSLEISPAGVSIKGRDSAGTYYALQTLLQCMKKSGGRVEMPSLKIRDWPDVKYRAMHYDTKHHQGTREAVELLIRDLASYKANVLVWEWEDKFAYRKHPDIGAPGAFSMEEMQALMVTHGLLKGTTDLGAFVDYGIVDETWAGVRDSTAPAAGN